MSKRIPKKYPYGKNLSDMEDYINYELETLKINLANAESDNSLLMRRFKEMGNDLTQAIMERDKAQRDLATYLNIPSESM